MDGKVVDVILPGLDDAEGTRRLRPKLIGLGGIVISKIIACLVVELLADPAVLDLSSDGFPCRSAKLGDTGPT